MTVYTKDDGTEIDEDTFSAFDPGSSKSKKAKKQKSKKAKKQKGQKNRQIYLLLLQRYSV